MSRSKIPEIKKLCLVCVVARILKRFNSPCGKVEFELFIVYAPAFAVRCDGHSTKDAPRENSDRQILL